MAWADVCRNIILLLGQRFAAIFEANTNSEHEEVRRRGEIMVFLSHRDTVLCGYQIARAVEGMFLRSLLRDYFLPPLILFKTGVDMLYMCWAPF